MNADGISIVREIVSKALEVPADRVTEGSSMRDLPGWDSLGHLNILVALDKRFSGRVAGISELAKAISVKEIALILQRHGIL